MSHDWCALCSLDFCWRGSVAQENPSHRETLPDDSVMKAGDKAVTPNWPSWPEVAQTHTGSSWAGTFSSGQSEQPVLPLNQKTCKVLSPVHEKYLFLRPACVHLHVTIATELPPLKLPEVTSAYPPSPKHDPKPRPTNVLILPVVQQEQGRTFSCTIWAGCLEQALLHIYWQMCTVQSEALRKFSGGDGLKINSWAVCVSWSLLAKGGKGGLAVPMQRLQTGVFQAEVVRLHYEDHAKKDCTIFLERGWSLTLLEYLDYHNASLPKVKLEPTWALPPKVKPEPTLSSPERWELSFSTPQTRIWSG